jgi:hypothetical protein
LRGKTLKKRKKKLANEEKKGRRKKTKLEKIWDGAIWVLNVNIDHWGGVDIFQIKNNP